jgi:hypothetical protein
VSRAVALVLAGVLGCQRGVYETGEGADAARTDTRASSEVPFARPEAYTPRPGACGLDPPAFCDTFESGPAAGGRSGELDPARWSVVRGQPYNSASFDDAFRIGPALIGDCRPDLSNTRVLPDADVLVCDPTGAIASRHVLAAVAAQNYGLGAYRIRQPFDFAGRTGTIKLDLELSSNNLGGWPALIIAAEPTPAPSFDWEERGSGPRHGVEVEFSTGCGAPRTVQPIVYSFRDYQQKRHAALGR